MDFTEARNADLMRAYKKCIREADRIYMPRILEAVANSPASRFWVSEERAAIVIAAMDAGRQLPRMRDTKLEMFQEIYRRYLIEKKLNPDKTILELVSIVVNQPAPKFYFTARTVGEFIYRIKNGWYAKQHGGNIKNPSSE